MPNSASILAYPDVKDAFDRALLGKGIKLTFKDYRAAVRFAARCNAYRLIERKENARIFEASDVLHGRSIYDTLRIIRNGADVELRPIVLDAEITDL